MALIGRCRLFRKVKYVRFTIDDYPQPPHYSSVTSPKVGSKKEKFYNYYQSITTRLIDLYCIYYIYYIYYLYIYYIYCFCYYSCFLYTNTYLPST